VVVCNSVGETASGVSTAGRAKAAEVSQA
jgi:hypothetical protein